MADRELIAYIKKCFEQNTPRENVYSLLLQNGWKNEDISAAFEEIDKGGEGEKTSKYQNEYSSKVIVGSALTLLAIGVGVYFLSISWFFQESPPQTEQPQVEAIPEKSPYEDWGNVSSELGFSLKYPYKEVGAIWGDDEYFQIGIVFPATLVTSDEKLSEQIYDNFGEIALAGAMISVTKDQAASADFESWIKTFLIKEDKSYSRKEFKVVSETISPVTFAGVNGYELSHSMEWTKGQTSLNFIRKEVFIIKDGFVYRFSNSAPSNDTEFPVIGDIGKNYLEKVYSISEEIFGTFTFDNSTITAITVPKTSPPQLTGDAAKRRNELLATLREKPFYDESKTYPRTSDYCDPGSTSSSDDLEGSLILFSGIYVGADDELADLHAYDENGRHTGLLPAIPGFENFFAPYEERAQGIDRIELGSDGYGLVITDNINGRIELVGKNYGFVNFDFRGDGNACTITEVLAPITPYSVATVPMTTQGDIGPVSYDLDGDGVEDFVLSLLHPLFPEKQLQLQAVIADIQAAE